MLDNETALVCLKFKLSDSIDHNLEIPLGKVLECIIINFMYIIFYVILYIRRG